MKGRRVRLFAYGTLQPQAGTRMGEWLARRTVWSGPAQAPGRLFGIPGAQGCYPAMRPPKGVGFVQGTLCELRLTGGDLALLDRYEGREYRRVALPVRIGSRRLRAQAYLWRTALPPAVVRIRGGDFMEWLGDTKGKAFEQQG